MDEWNKLVEQKWNHWEYYRDLFDFRISKAANSIFTRHLYPVFYQQSLLKKEFVENMQLLGELSATEVDEYTKLTKSSYLKYSYYYHHNPSRWIHSFYGWDVLFLAGVISVNAFLTKKTFGYKIVIPALFLLFGTMAKHKYLEKKLTQVVDMTQWALEKRKAEVWLQEKNHPVAKMTTFPRLNMQIQKIIYDIETNKTKDR